MMKKLSLWIIVHIVFTAHSQAPINKKVALVIGIQHYSAIAPLRNTLNDAHDMAATLKKKGFEVMELYDPETKRELQDGLMKYFNRVVGDPELAGLIYYSGHGMQVDGVNYLIPTRADPKVKADLDDQCVKMEYLMKVLEEAGNPLNILIMDACRNNPFRGFSRGTERGLNIVDTPKGSYIVYATKPGSVASDGEGVNGLFTSKLLKYINEPSLNIEQVFKKVAKDVAEESHDEQRPWISSDYTGDFYFTQTVNEVRKDSEFKTDKSAVEVGSVATREVATESLHDPEELYTSAKALLASEKISEAVFNFERAGNSGHVKSQTELGNLYRKNAQVEQDYSKSLAWFRKAADQGDLLAQNAVGEFYLNGLGVSEDHPAALSWFQKAANKNYPGAQFNIGIMYLNGRGVAKSEQEAAHWFTRAADQDFIPAQNKLGSLYLIGGDTLRKNKSEAIKWFRKAAALGDTWAKETLNSLGY